MPCQGPDEAAAVLGLDVEWQPSTADTTNLSDIVNCHCSVPLASARMHTAHLQE